MGPRLPMLASNIGAATHKKAKSARPSPPSSPSLLKASPSFKKNKQPTHNQARHQVLIEPRPRRPHGSRHCVAYEWGQAQGDGLRTQVKEEVRKGGGAGRVATPSPLCPGSRVSAVEG